MTRRSSNKRSNEISSQFLPEKKRCLKDSSKTSQSLKQEYQNLHHRSPSPPPPQFSQIFCKSFEFVEDPNEKELTSRKLRSPFKQIKKEESDTIQHVKCEDQINFSEDSKEYLPKVPDHVKDGMDVLMVGSNPGRMSSIKCQHFGHPSNHFYKALYQSGFTSSLVQAKNDFTMVHQMFPLLSLGLTNLASRPTRMAQEVKKDENEEGAIILTDLIRQNRPRVGFFVGIGVAKAFEQAMIRGAEINLKDEGDSIDSSIITIDIPKDVPLVTDSELGLGVGLMSIAIRHDNKLDDRPPFTLLFASPSTSGRVTSHQLPQKAECMKRARILAQSTFFSGFDQCNLTESSSKRVRIRLI